MNAKVMSTTVLMPSMLYTASTNTTAAVATPFGASSAMINISLTGYSLCTVNQAARNLMIVYAANSIPDVMKNSVVYGILMMSPVSMKIRIYSALVNTLSTPKILIFSLT